MAVLSLWRSPCRTAAAGFIDACSRCLCYCAIGRRSCPARQSVRVTRSVFWLDGRHFGDDKRYSMHCTLADYAKERCADESRHKDNERDMAICRWQCCNRIDDCAVDAIEQPDHR